MIWQRKRLPDCSAHPDLLNRVLPNVGGCYKNDHISLPSSRSSLSPSLSHQTLFCICRFSLCSTSKWKTWSYMWEVNMQIGFQATRQRLKKKKKKKIVVEIVVLCRWASASRSDGAPSHEGGRRPQSAGFAHAHQAGRAGSCQLLRYHAAVLACQAQAQGPAPHQAQGPAQAAAQHCGVNQLLWRERPPIRETTDGNVSYGSVSVVRESFLAMWKCWMMARAFQSCVSTRHEIIFVV